MCIMCKRVCVQILKERGLYNQYTCTLKATTHVTYQREMTFEVNNRLHV